MFVLPYAASVLFHNEDARVEICVEDPDAWLARFHDGKAVLEHTFGDGCLTIRTGSFAGHAPNSVRFLEVPTHLTEYTYIGDIDVLMLTHDIREIHLAHMENTGLPYSNIRRAGRSTLTGLHFTRTDAFYPQDERAVLGHQRDDEALLAKLVVARGLPLPSADDSFRPVHGFHLSLNRKPTNDEGPSWRLLEKWIDAYRTIRQSELWKRLRPHFDRRYVFLLYLMEAALEAKFPGRNVMDSGSVRQALLQIFPES